ncbi:MULTISPECIES: osmoprotectant ABC transporter substrate-binding protein [Vagococcus]|uniref:Osmotically activated L-carnitine/choline ABC transporter, substrate-binding protein OpuCC n=1 Tax=Vagococcus fluvialis bH819 TaxID=1255619 RepID=A0A1X6WLY7_9ENTE|nr:MULTISPECIES: osmoprotectant ABC transporter substrate-binding protein [Vagococcus]SLM85353.1 Osmotically activated L-carnitine/choline ABC transporter, substrate-binding protein OpuCC [Vagococcus fluvialis bH819]HCM89353.1 osmoprotectant ABC transporter substrate-binding protein [Vagococcus sp.]
MKKKSIFGLIIISSAIFWLGGCSFPGLGGANRSEETIAIGSMATSENQILANLTKQMIEHYTDEKVVMINNLGTSTVAHNAMVNEDINISAGRYTGTDLSGTLNLEPEKDPKKAFEIVSKEFKSRYQQEWLPSYGFANTYAFMVSKKTAEKYKLEKISDLKNVAGELTAGVDTSWINRDGDGYKAFSDTYDVSFKKVYPMQIGLVYDAVAAEKMDVVLGYSTDGRISSYDLVILEDDLKFFPPYDASIVMSETLIKNKPELKPILEKLSGKIDTETMQQLNYEADNNLLEPENVARQFLRDNNFFEGDDN